MVKKKFRIPVAALVIGLAVLLQACANNKSASAPATTAKATQAEAQPTASAAVAASPTASAAPEKPNVLEVKFYSDALKQDRKFHVYLPKGYDEKGAYPVLYMYHIAGATGAVIDEMGFPQHADQLIADGKIKPLIIVSPDIETSYGVNSDDSTRCFVCSKAGLYEDYLAKDLVAYVDSHYATIKSKEGRFIGGFSAGGFAALHVGLANPDLFSRVGGHSAALHTDEWESMYPTPELKKERDPFELAKSGKLGGTTVYLDCGEQDPLIDAAAKLYDVLQANKVKSEYHHGVGAHNFSYWNAQVDNYLQFYAGV